MQLFISTGPTCPAAHKTTHFTHTHVHNTHIICTHTNTHLQQTHTHTQYDAVIKIKTTQNDAHHQFSVIGDLCLCVVFQHCTSLCVRVVIVFSCLFVCLCECVRACARHVFVRACVCALRQSRKHGWEIRFFWFFLLSFSLHQQLANTIVMGCVSHAQVPVSLSKHVTLCQNRLISFLWREKLIRRRRRVSKNTSIAI